MPPTRNTPSDVPMDPPTEPPADPPVEAPPPPADPSPTDPPADSPPAATPPVEVPPAEAPPADSAKGDKKEPARLPPAAEMRAQLDEKTAKRVSNQLEEIIAHIIEAGVAGRSSIAVERLESGVYNQLGEEGYAIPRDGDQYTVSW